MLELCCQSASFEARNRKGYNVREIPSCDVEIFVAMQYDLATTWAVEVAPDYRSVGIHRKGLCSLKCDLLQVGRSLKDC